jgi:hypothetical protein
MDSFRRLILPGFFRIGVNGGRHFGRRPVATLQVSYRPFEDLRVRQAHPTSKYPEEDRGALSAPNRFMAQTALEPHLMLANGNFLDWLMSDRG